MELVDGWMVDPNPNPKDSRS
ncbi:Transposase [Cupriavidus oxalaticus]|uniref:Uncharacterized protein n=1 Tax=Cupriavidus oxalaticus TaxID=96344 RepID=A0A375GIP1_9BURK|nr:hypothetical protein CO2235_U990007 [Cupriavidus oxalaticus]SPC19760.1 hypothetical protein CO2235_MP20171 [Cupriavidus oxalaticus]